MSLSKQQMVGFGVGGLFTVVAGVLGYMLYDAAMARGEAEERLEEEMARFRQYNEAAVFPSKKSIDSVKSNEVGFVDWRAEALNLAARGDCPPPVEEEPSVFKQRLQTEVRRLSALPGEVNGHISAPEFLFGFEQYLGESGVLPQSADVPRLSVQLATIAHVVELLSEAGASEVKGIQRLESKVASEAEEGGKSKKKSKKKSSKSEDEDAPKMTSLEYAFDLTAHPAALVKILNRLAADTRFFVVRDFAFQQSADTILNSISAKESAETQSGAATGGRRRRRGAVEQPALGEAPGQDGSKKVDRLVVDPESDAPIHVTFSVAVYDFGHGAVAQSAVSGDEKPAAVSANGKEAK